MSKHREEHSYVEQKRVRSLLKPLRTHHNLQIGKPTQHNRSRRIVPEIDWPDREQYACARRKVDHDRDADARTARSTAVSCAPSSCPLTTRTTAPASLISMIGAAGVVRACDRRSCVLRNDRHEPGELWTRPASP